MDVIKFVTVCITVLTSTSVFFLSTNANFNNAFARDTNDNASVIVENKTLSPKDLLCDDGNHPGIKGICADGSHPLVIRANPVPVTGKSLNQTYPATTKVVSLCADSTIAEFYYRWMSRRLPAASLSTDDLTCTDGNRPDPNGTCTDGSLPLILNKTQTSMILK